MKEGDIVKLKGFIIWDETAEKYSYLKYPYDLKELRSYIHRVFFLPEQRINELTDIIFNLNLRIKSIGDVYEHYEHMNVEYVVKYVYKLEPEDSEDIPKKHREHILSYFRSTNFDENEIKLAKNNFSFIKSIRG